MVATADDGEQLAKLGGLEFASEFALEDDDVSATECTVPARGGGRVAFGEEVVCGGTDFGEVVDVGIFWECVAEFGERCWA